MAALNRGPVRAAPTAGKPDPAAREPTRRAREVRAPSGGRPLPPTTRERMEAAFGVGLADVRVHTDAKLTDEHDADALTIGRDIVFAPGQQDQHLLAHELAHVVQQGPAEAAAARGPSSEPAEPAEREAEAAADRVVRGHAANVVPGAAAWSTRARIMRRARAGAAGEAGLDMAERESDRGRRGKDAADRHEDAADGTGGAPGPVAATTDATPEPDAEAVGDEAVVIALAADVTRRLVAARTAAQRPDDGRPAAPSTSMPAPERAPAPRAESAMANAARAANVPERLVEPVARAPPVLASGAPIIQTKLEVSTPGDALEQEADAVAARVLRWSGPVARSVRSSSSARGPPITPAVRAVVDAPAGGRPLDTAVRARIEPHVGVPLDHVRVRQDPASTAAARDLHARAFTSGATIFLGAGASAGDVGLMAHESVHVAQQRTIPQARMTLMRDVSEYLPDVSVTDLIPDWILDGVKSAVRAIPGFTLLTYITGRDPLTGEPVAVGPEQLIETLLTWGPFGQAVGPVLQTIEVLGEIFEFVSESLADHDLTLARLQRDVESAWDEFSVANGIAGNVAIVGRYLDALLRDIRAFVESIVERVLAIVREVVAAVAEPLLETPEIAPIWNLTKKVIHYDPLRGEGVEASTAEIIADFLRLIGEEQRLAQMEERGTLQETADWLDTQLGTFTSLIAELGTLFSDAWAAIQPENLPNLLDDLGALAQRAFGFVQRVGEFAATVILKILELIKDALLGWLSEHAHSVPGFHLLTVILGQNPFTGEAVPRTAENLIRGFITLLPGGEATYDELAESGVIAEAAGRIESEMSRLGISLEMITGLFRGIWDELSLDDLLDPLGPFGRILDLFGEPLGRLIEFIGVVVRVVIELVLQLMNFPTELLASIIANTLQAIEDIKRDPVGFLKNMLAAVKLGLSNFFDNILGHLGRGLAAWLFRGLGRLGITIPSEINLQSIVTLVLQVLGISAESLWTKLGQHIGPERVALIRRTIDRLTGAWEFIKDVQEHGISAVWRYVREQLSNLWETLLGMAREWIVSTIVRRVTARLLTLLDPTGVMAVVNGFIAFFSAVQSAIEYLRDILEIVDRYVSTLAAVAAGDVVPGAQMLEQGLAAAIPVAIGFLANQVGLGNVPEQIVILIQRLRQLVDRALDWLITQAIRLGQAALDALGAGGRQPAAVSAHEAILRDLVPRLEADPAEPELDEGRWFAHKQQRAAALVAETQPRLEPGVRLTIDIARGPGPRQLIYSMDIAPNTTSTAGATVAPQLTVGERYTFFDDLRGNNNPEVGRFRSASLIGSQWVIWYDPGESRETEYKMTREGRPIGHGVALTARPAYRADGTQNFRIAGAGGGENPVFRVISSHSGPHGVYADEVEAEPLALSAYSAPRETPPGLARILLTLHASGAWVPGHLVNGSMGGPGTNDNMVPIPITTNAAMRGNYENTLRTDLQLGKYYYFHARVAYHPSGASSTIGRTSDFVRSIDVDYQEITKTGTAWTRVGTVSNKPFTVALPDVTELEPARIAS